MISLHEINNLNLALQLLKKEGVRMTNISAEDIHTAHVKLILGLLWILIRHYVLVPQKKQRLLAQISKQSQIVMTTLLLHLNC